MNENIINDRLAALSPEYSEFIESDFIDEVADSFGKEAGLNQNKINILNNAFSLYLLFFLSFDEFISFINTECGLEKDESTTLAQAIVLTLPEGFEDLQKSAREAFTLVGPSDLESEIIKAEAELEAIPKIRTMANDMTTSGHIIEDEIVHSSTQDSLIKENSQDTESTKGKWETG